MDISKITDIKELKALKSDQHDIMETAQENYLQAKKNIANILIRIKQVKADQVAKESAETSKPKNIPVTSEEENAETKLPEPSTPDPDKPEEV